MWSAPRITTLDTQRTESTSTALWTTTLLSITPRWRTLNSSGKMRQRDQWLKRGSRQCQCRTDPNTAQQWDPLRAHFKLLFTQLRLCLTEMSQTNTKCTRKFKKHNSLLILYLSWGHRKLSGSLPQKLHLQREEDPSWTLVTIHSRTGSTSLQSGSKREESSRWGERTDGTHTSNLFLNTTSKSMQELKLGSKEFENEMKWNS